MKTTPMIINYFLSFYFVLIKRPSLSGNNYVLWLLKGGFKENINKSG